MKTLSYKTIFQEVMTVKFGTQTFIKAQIILADKDKTNLMKHTLKIPISCKIRKKEKVSPKLKKRYKIR